MFAFIIAIISTATAVIIFFVSGDRRRGSTHQQLRRYLRGHTNRTGRESAILVFAQRQSANSGRINNYLIQRQQTKRNRFRSKMNINIDRHLVVTGRSNDVLCIIRRIVVTLITSALMSNLSNLQL